MSYVVQQADINVLKQAERRLYAKIDLLNHNFQTIYSIDGALIDDNYSEDAESDVRRTYTLTMHVASDLFLVGRDRAVWLDKYVRISIGIYYIRTDSILWYPRGVYCFDRAGYSFDAAKNELSLSCVDRMAELTGVRNGQIGGAITKIPAGSSIRNSMISVVTQLGGIEKYSVDDMGGNTVPYDLEFSRGSNVYDMIVQLRDLYPGYETFFDGETFVCQAYPTYESDPVALDADIIDPLVISEDTEYDFTQIHNVVEVWGKCHDSDYYTENVTSAAVSGDSQKIVAVYETSPSPSNGRTFGFKLPSGVTNTSPAYFQVGTTNVYPLLDSNKQELAAGIMESGKAYVVKYHSTNSGYYELLGQYQIVAVAKMVSVLPAESENDEPVPKVSYVVDPTNPFCREYDLGEIRLVCQDGEYENIYSDTLAEERAKYELWLATDLQDTITLNMLDIPWLDVNTKISYRSNRTGDVATYLIKSKSGSSISGVMTITAIRFKPTYPWT